MPISPLVMPEANFAMGFLSGRAGGMPGKGAGAMPRATRVLYGVLFQGLLFYPLGALYLQCIARHACRMRRRPTPPAGALHTELTSLGLGFLTSAAHAA